MSWYHNKYKHSLATRGIKTTEKNNEYKRNYRINHPELKEKELEYGKEYYYKNKDEINRKKREYRKTEAYQQWKENHKNTQKYKDKLKRRYKKVKTIRDKQKVIQEINKYNKNIQIISNKYNIEENTAEIVFQLRNDIKYMNRQEILDFTEQILEIEGIDFLNMIFNI